MTGKDFFSLAFGSMIGIGWVVSAPLWITNAGTAGAISAMIITALIVIPIGFVYSELCTSIKVVGGEFAYVFKLMGRLPSFITGWFLILGYLTMYPWVALSVSSMIAYLFPQIETIKLYTILGNTLYLPELIIGLVMIWGLTWLNMKGVESSKLFQNCATTLLLISFVIFFIGCFAAGKPENLHPMFSSNGKISGIMLAISSMIFFMNGFDTIPKAADEADSQINPRNLAKALVGTILLGSAIYILVIICSSLVMVTGDEVNLGALPLVAAYENATGSKLLVVIMIIGTIMGVITTFNGFDLAGSKLIGSFAASGFMQHSLGDLSTKKTHSNSLLFIAIISTIGVFMGKGLLAPLITLGGLAFLVAWLFMALSCLVFRRKQPDATRPFRVPGGKPIIAFAIFVCSILIIMMIIPGTLISMGAMCDILLLVWIIAGAAVYLHYKKQSIELRNR